jgi:hypothetical protein
VGSTATTPAVKRLATLRAVHEMRLPPSWAHGLNAPFAPWWQVQLFQNWPEIVPNIVPFAKPPYYANSDDQVPSCHSRRRRCYRHQRA